MPPRQPLPRLIPRHWPIGGAIAIAAYAGWAVLVPGSRALGLTATLLVVAAWTIAPLATLPTARRLTSPSARWAWNLLGIGLSLWALAEALKASSWIAGHPLPVPSLADLLRMAGYFSAAAALGSYPARPRERFGWLREVLDLTILSLAVLALSWMIFIRPVLELQVASPIQILWVACAPAFDLVLAALLVRLILLRSSRQEVIVFRLLGLGVLFLAVSDLVGGYLGLQGELRPGTLIDVGWMTAGLLFAVASWSLGKSEASSADALDTGGGRRASRIEPLLAVAFTYAVVGYAALDWRFSGTLDWIGIGVGATLSLLLFARQGAIAGQIEMRQFAAIVNASTDLTFICREDGSIRLANPTLRRAIGVGEAEALDIDLRDLLSGEAPADQVLSLALAEGWSGEVAFSRRDGSSFPVSLSLTPVQDERRPRPMLVGTANDLSSVKAREAELRSALSQVAAARGELEALNRELEHKVEARTQELARMVADLARLNDELKELDRLKSEFVTLVSHELRAPLTNIRSGVELVLAGSPEEDPAARDTLHLVMAETERLGSFVETILDLSALEAGRFPIELGPLEVDVVARMVCTRFPEFAGGLLHDDIPADLPAVLADERALTSVFFHLLDNARKYAPEGEIRLEACPEGTCVRVSVSDNGPGIPPEERERVFEVFHRLDSSDSREVYGHGLGLHLVRQLLLAMGGRIAAEEAPGGGARLTFWLPQAA